MNPLNVRPCRDWALVRCDPRKTELASGIVLPPSETGAEKVMERAGTLLRLGVGVKAEKLGLQPGQRILFRGFLKHAQPVEADDGSECFLMSIDDILSIIDDTTEVGAFSGRPMNPEMR